MTLGRKDLAATVFTALVVLVFAASHEGWDVPLVGDSHRWAAAAILLLGMATCTMGSSGEGVSKRSWTLFGTIGAATLAFGIVALITGSLTALSLLVVGDVLLWAMSTVRHAHGATPGRPVHTRAPGPGAGARQPAPGPRGPSPSRPRPPGAGDPATGRASRRTAAGRAVRFPPAWSRRAPTGR